MAPTHKRSGSDPDNNKGRRILGCFRFLSKMIRKESAKVEVKAVPKWGETTFKVVQLSHHHIHHHAMPLAKLLFIDPEISPEKRDGIGKLMKQFDQVPKDNYGAEFETQSRFEGSKSNQMKESRCKLDSQKSCRKRMRKRSGGLSRWKLEGDAIAAMAILMVILIIMLLCGRLCAIICASICLYCLPRFTKTIDCNTKSNSNDEKQESSEFDSEAYRRKVVLEGILARKSKMELGIS